MSVETAKLLSEFEALPVEQKQEFVREVMNHLPPWDSGPLDDDAVAAAGDAVAAMFDEEETCLPGGAKSGCLTAVWSRKCGQFSSSAFPSLIPIAP